MTNNNGLGQPSMLEKTPAQRPITPTVETPSAAAVVVPIAAPSTATFASFGLPEELAIALTRMNFTIPTEIQSKAIPFGLQGKDILGSAQTGTGKTFAFVIPMLTKLMNSSRGSALILLPTRELAVQVEAAVSTLLGFRNKIRTAVLIGGEPMPKQYTQLRANPRIIVGTPGRINDHLQRGTLKLHDAGFLVLDETDRMLDMGFGIQIDEIVKYLPKQRQTMLFSATIPAEIARLSKNYLVDPVRVSAGSTTTPAAKIKQVVIETSEEEKYGELLKILEVREGDGSVIIFCKTKRGVEKLWDKLSRKGYKADCIHGDLKQSRRDRVIASYRAKKFNILVATDVAARGLDVPHIDLVINYDLPQCPEDFIHRIGRTARAGAEGEAISLVSPADKGKWRDIQRLLSPDANKGGNDNHKRDGNRNYGPKRNNGGGNRLGENRSRKGGRHEGGNRFGGNREGDASRENFKRDGSNGDRGSFNRENTNREGGNGGRGSFNRENTNRDGGNGGRRSFNRENTNRESSNGGREEFKSESGNRNDQHKPKKGFFAKRGGVKTFSFKKPGGKDGKPTKPAGERRFFA
ncbi:MAG: box helicase [Rickettsiaceae bacterium]|jgi:superfamily II DNA/RNA helicase|nr:box helicase [Rickettsiaceae bacterium]